MLEPEKFCRTWLLSRKENICHNFSFGFAISFFVFSKLNQTRLWSFGKLYEREFLQIFFFIYITRIYSGQKLSFDYWYFLNYKISFLWGAEI